MTSIDKTDHVFSRILGPNLQTATLRLFLIIAVVAAVVAAISLAFAP
jgi:hypothetical protein